jgi:hypothetical protein
MRLRIPLIVLAVLVVLGVTSALVVPPIVRGQLDKALSSTFTEPAALGSIRFNPLTFTLTLKRFRLPARGDSLASFDRLAIGFDLFSPFRGAWTFRTIELDRPVIGLVLERGGTLNLARLLKPQPPSRDPAAEPPRLRFLDIMVRQGSLGWADETRDSVFATELDTLSLHLRDFRTERRANNDYELSAETPSGERLAWHGRFTLAPFTSIGGFQLGDLKLRTLDQLLAGTLPFRFRSGGVDLAARYRLDAGVTPAVFTLDSLETDLRDVAMIDTRSDSTAIFAHHVATHAGTVDPMHARLNLGHGTAAGVRVLMAILADGHMDMERWGQPMPGAPPDSAPSWVVTADSITATDAAVRMLDLRLPTPARFQISNGTVTVHDFSNAQDATFPIAVACSTGAAGSTTATGTLGLDPLLADLQLDVSAFDLRVIQPYIDAFAKLELQRGTVDAAGRLRFDPAGVHGPMVRFEGEASSRDLRTRDRILQQDFLTWSRLRLHGLAADVMPTRLIVKDVELVQPYIRAVVAPDRTTNFQQVFTPPAPPPPAFAAASTDTPEVRIGRVTVRDGSAWFADLSLTPNFATAIQQLEGTITNLSSIQQTGGEVQLAGKVDKYAPVTISGRIDPLGGAGRTELGLDFKGIELTAFTPYAGKFAGYRIRKGKLNLNLQYAVAGRQLKGENKVFLDQLTLGERVDSPDATHLPVRFAIALLKDRNGNIDLDIPVEGSLDDPKFSVMRIIFKVLLNLLTKAVTSPFKLLGALVGGGGGEESFEAVEFAPGQTALSADGVAGLDKLAKALIDRPSLKLEIEQTASIAQDSSGLVALRYDDLLGGSMTEDDRRSASVPTRLPPHAYAGVVERAYVKAFGPLAKEKTKKAAHRGAAADSAALAAEAIRHAGMEQRLRESIHVTAADCAELARVRSIAIKQHLLTPGGVPEERLFIVSATTPAWTDTSAAGAALAVADSTGRAAPKAALSDMVRVRLSLTSD